MGARGEATISLDDGREVQVLYTNRALAEAEQALQQSVLEVAQGFADGHSGVYDVAVLLRCGMEAARREARMGGGAISLNNAYEVLDAAGFSAVAAQVMGAVAAVLSYAGGEAGDPKN